MTDRPSAARLREFRDALDSPGGDSGRALVYQPIVPLESDVPIGFEALVRWKHPRLGPLRPAEFPRIGERPDLSRRLDRRVLRMVVRQAATWNHRGRSFGWISVNLSGTSLDDFGIVDFSHRLLRHYPDVAAEEIAVEVSEEDALDPRRLDVVRRLSTVVGLPVMVDRVRLDASSRVELRDVPVRLLKLDMDLSRGAAREGTDPEKVDRIVDLGRDLNVDVIAQGVESERQMQWFRERGVDGLQGYHAGRPAAPSTL